MSNDVHPVVMGLRSICAGNLVKYEALIALMQEHFFKRESVGTSTVQQKSLDQFLTELYCERETYFSAEDTYKMLAEGAQDPTLLKAIFKKPTRKKPR